MTPLTREQRQQFGRMGAASLHAQGKTNTIPALAAFEERFANQVDPDRKLSEAERAKRIKHAKSLYFARLALASAKARKS